MKQPLISIVVPAYNVENYVSKCIDSILNQTYSNWELLLIVGGQDSTPSICDEYASKDSRIKAIHDNKGLAPARNVGFHNAVGEWITYIDGDDWVEPNMLEYVIQKINGVQELDLVFWTYSTDLNGMPVNSKWSYNEFEDNKIYKDGECKDLALRTLNYSSGISTCPCKMINMKYAKKYNLQHDCRLSQGEEGVEFILRCFYHAKNALFLNNRFYHYVVNPKSISKKVNYQNTQKIADCFEVMLEDIENFEKSEKYKPYYYERIVYAIIAVAMNTYFSPSNSDSFWDKKRYFKNDVLDKDIFFEAINKVSTHNLDILRKVTFFAIKKKMFLSLQIIAWIKAALLKINFYNY